VDPKKEQIAVSEARKLGVPVIAIVDTNCDPNEVDYPVPGNDDAIRAIRLFTSRVAGAVLEGSNLRMKQAGDGPSTEDLGTEGEEVLAGQPTDGAVPLRSQEDEPEPTRKAVASRRGAGPASE